ncbi:MAG: peptidoglycan-N-acetylglucosamine deacetylase [Solirubrobacteraceae bacterium]|jgi:peptidoglycan/xylan/chitin deacetylase (PgdA/CDA1 family)|nr:peptidoglycan-N-acetylglucosamine deacetylase [Solirubrobacteraceae bacterium]
MRAPTAAILAVALALVAAPAASAATDPADAPLSPLDLTSATLRQDGADLVVSVRTAGDWASRALSRRGRSLCLVVAQGARRFVCAAVKPSGGPQLTVNLAGGSPSLLIAKIDRPDGRTLNARFAWRDIGLKVGSIAWSVTSTWTDSTGCAAAAPGCNDRLPDRGTLAARLTPPAATGCAARGPSYVTNGPRTRRAVALTFDDGPGTYTGRVLDVLKRTGAKGTFFVLGQQVTSGELLRRALREGHAIGNHSYNHANLSGGGMGQMTSTNAAIRRTTGYTPCIFRAPYGAVSGLLIGQARSLGMLTIQWDVDPRDWSRPGSGAIMAGRPASAARVLADVHPGSIVVMHDGGGPRDQTVAALPGIIASLQRRGYRLVTVPELLGLRSTYG